MLLNSNIAVSTSTVLLVPYSKRHVLKYHEWMQDEEIQQATASEPLILEEEFSMQQSWRQDADKLTFIACLPLSSSSPSSLSTTISDEDDAPDRMIGDTNLFLRYDDDDDDDDGSNEHISSKEGRKHVEVIGEIELMIAEKKNQGKGFGRAALTAFMWYVICHEEDILQEFLRTATTSEEKKTVLPNSEMVAGSKMKCLSVKIGQENSRSLALFESLGFERVAQEPNYFGEFELRNYNMNREEIVRLLDKYNVRDYKEMDYKAE